MKLLGAGGMGSVYLANDPTIDQQVAVKIIRTDMDGYTDSTSAGIALERFRQEARAVARLDHLHILPLYRYGEEETPQGQRAYMIMQYRPEGSLWDWLRRRADIAAGNLQPTQSELSFGLPINWPLGLQEVAEYVQQAASALQYAHDRGIVHRDIKPANFLLRIDLHDKNAHLLLSDFGLAKVFTNSSATNTILGTPTYMAPEQFDGATRPESDQYALAVMTYYMLAGRAPFEGDPMQLMRQHLSAPAPSLTASHPGIPPAVNAVVTRALAKRPEQRFPTVTAFAEALSTATLGQPQSMSFSLPPSPLAPTQGRGGLSGVAATTPAGRSSQGPLILPGVSDAGMRNDAATAMYVPPAPTAYPAPGMRGPAGNAPQGYVQQTMTPRPIPGYPPRPGAQQSVSRRSALGWILGGAAVAAVGAGAGVYFYTQSQNPGSTVNNGGNPQTTPSTGSSVSPTPTSPLLHRLIGHTAAVTSVSWVSDGLQLATGSLDATARLWTPDGSAGVVISAASAIHALAWSPDGNTLATGEEDHYVQFWETTGASLVKSGGWGASVDALVWLSDTILYLGTGGTGVHAFDLSNNKHYIKNTPAHVNGVALSPDGHYLASALASGLVSISKLTGSGGAVASLPFIHGAAYSVAWSPDGSMLAVGYADGHAIIYNASTHHQLYSLKHGGPVYSVAWSPNATSAAPLLVSGSGDNTVNVWNLVGEGNPTIYTGHTDAVLSVSWGANLIASASKDQTAILWQPPSA